MNADPHPTNELITGIMLSGADLEILEAGTTHVVDLSTLGGGDALGNHSAT